MVLKCVWHIDVLRKLQLLIGMVANSHSNKSKLEVAKQKWINWHMIDYHWEDPQSEKNTSHGNMMSLMRIAVIR